MRAALQRLLSHEFFTIQYGTVRGGGGGIGAGATSEHWNRKTSARLTLPHGSSQSVPLITRGQLDLIEPTFRQVHPFEDTEQFRV